MELMVLEPSPARVSNNMGVCGAVGPHRPLALSRV
ncbi:hypothetical protein NOCA2350029 [metagenome]|uniref:Uncharacterized protein n=1 Tax=metagenome TaxID=256318 RepID=A0A2P2C392_9ZZZZ